MCNKSAVWQPGVVASVAVQVCVLLEDQHLTLFNMIHLVTFTTMVLQGGDHTL